MTQQIEETLGADATAEELAMTEWPGEAAPEPKKAPTAAPSGQDQALDRQAFDDFKPRLTATTTEAKAALALALEGYQKADAEHEAARKRRQKAETRREEILGNEELSERQQVDALTKVNAEEAVYAHKARNLEGRADQSRAALAPLYRQLLAALREEVAVLHHRRRTLQVRRLQEVAGADSDDFEAARLIEDLAEHHPGVWILWAWKYESQFDASVPAEMLPNACQRLLEAADWLAAEKAKEGEA